MAKLAPEEILRHQAWLSEWRTPEGAGMYISDVNDHMGSTAFLSQPGLTFLREMYLASKFAAARGLSEIRLITGERPDFEVRGVEGIERFECVEADLADRKRSEEYREAEDATRPFELYVEDPMDDFDVEIRQIPTALRTAAKSKAGKGYSPDTCLLIYLNIYSAGCNLGAVSASFRADTAASKGHFAGTWVLWAGKAFGPYHVWG